MRLHISTVADKGDAQKERIVLKAESSLDVGEYILIRSGFFDSGVTIDVHNTFWFPYKSVSPGDLVVLYTKKGVQSEKRLASGATAHFFYWGLTVSIWSRDDRAPVLLHAPEWESKSPSEI